MMRLTGEYRGWAVMEAWFDRSARFWDEAGLLVGRDDDDELNSQKNGGARAEGSGAGLGYGDIKPPTELGSRSANANGKLRDVQEEEGQVASSSSPTLLVSTDGGADGSSSSNQDRQLVSPLASNNKPAFSNDPSLLSPIPVKASKPPHHLSTSSVSAAHPVAQLDLPTRSDVVAATAVAEAEESKLRGGWIMGPQVVDQVEDHRSSFEKKLPPAPGGGGGPSSVEAISVGMVDVDLEGGMGERFGNNSNNGSARNSVEAGRTLSPTNETPGRSSSPFGFLRRSSQDDRSPAGLPLPMSLPGTPPFTSAPTSPEDSTKGLPQLQEVLVPPPPMGRVKSPLGSPVIKEQFAELQKEVAKQREEEEVVLAKPVQVEEMKEENLNGGDDEATEEIKL